MSRAIKSRLAGLCVLLPILLGLFGGSAQAETGATWTYINAKGELKIFTGSLKAKLKLDIESSSIGITATTTGGTKVEIRCTALSLVGSPSLLENGSISEGQTRLSGCKTFLNGTESKSCQPHSAGAAAGEIITKKFVGLIKLHLFAFGSQVDTVILLTPTSKNGKGEFSFAVIEVSELCSVGESIEVTGELSLIDCQKKLSTHQTEHLFEEYEALRLLRMFGQAAAVGGSSFLSLEGEHKGLKWAGLPSPTKP